ATGREANAERIRDLGATPIPYDATDWTAELQRATGGRGVDVVLDTHYHSTFLPSLDQIAEDGLIVTLPTLADLSPATERGLRARIPRIRPGRDRLDRIVHGIRASRLPIDVSQVLTLDYIAS